MGFAVRATDLLSLFARCSHLPGRRIARDADRARRVPTLAVGTLEAGIATIIVLNTNDWSLLFTLLPPPSISGRGLFATDLEEAAPAPRTA